MAMQRLDRVPQHPSQQQRKLSPAAILLLRAIELKATTYESMADVGIGKSMLNMSTQTQVDAASCGNATSILDSNGDGRVVMVDAATQTGPFAASESQPCNASSPEMSSHVKGAGLVNSDGPASEGSPDDCHRQVEAETPEHAFADNSQISNLASEATLMDSPTGSLSPSMMQQDPSEEDSTAITALEGGDQGIYICRNQLSTEQNSGHSPQSEETGSVIQDVGKTNSAAKTSAVVPEEMLVTEKAAHQQTRKELSRLEDWCKCLEAENTELQDRAEYAESDNARIQRQTVIVEDEIMSYQTELSGAEGQIRNLIHSNEMYISTIEGLQRQEADLNAEIAWYVQLGIDFYGRLQKAGQLLNPHDEVYGYYQRLLGDAAQYFSMPAEAGDGNGEVDDHIVRVEEIDDEERDEGVEDDEETGGFLPTDEAVADQAQVHVTTLYDDEVPCADRPMRPGTANGVPISVFGANNGDASNGPSSSLFGDFGEQARPPATSAFPTSFNFSEISGKLDKNSGATTASEPEPSIRASRLPARNRSRKGGIKSNRESQRHGPSGPPGSHLVDENLPPGESVRNRDHGVGSSLPPGTAFPINFGFSKPAVRTEGQREANAVNS